MKLGSCLKVKNWEKKRSEVIVSVDEALKKRLSCILIHIQPGITGALGILFFEARARHIATSIYFNE